MSLTCPLFDSHSPGWRCSQAEPLFTPISLSLGDRLYGRNELCLTVRFDSERALKALRAASLQLAMEPPNQPVQQSHANFTVTSATTPGEAEARIAYNVTTMCHDSQQQYRLTLALKQPGKIDLKAQYLFGTPRPQGVHGEAVGRLAPAMACKASKGRDGVNRA